MKINSTKNKSRINDLYRMFFVLFILFFFQNQQSFSQSVSLSHTRLTLKNAFVEIEKQTGMSVDYNQEVIDVNKTVSVPARTGSLPDILAALLQGTGCSYVIKENHIVVSRIPVMPPASKKKITGTVTDHNGEPVIGANIVEKGTNNGIITDIDGSFSLSVSDNAILQISYVGYIPQEIPTRNKTTFQLVLKENSQALEEVVVVGFGTQKKVNLTGAVGSIDSKALADRPIQNVSQALQGLIPGLNITQSTGALEDKSAINIRGVGTIGNTYSDPLVLIDGMEGDINAINPQDIDNISVLKDAAASAIYGSRAAFGVILVTTKKGTTSDVKINYNNSLRLNTPIVLPKMMDSYTFALYFNEAGLNGGSAGFFTERHLQRIKEFQEGKITQTVFNCWNNPQYYDGYSCGCDNIDWYNEVYKKSAFSHEHNLSVTGGKEGFNYYLSGNFLDQDGLIKPGKDGFNRYAVTGKINATLASWAELNYTSRFIHEKYEKPSALTNDLYSNIARQGWPMLPLYDPNGYLFSSPSPVLGLQEGGREKYQSDWLYNQLQLVLEPIEGWKIFGELNYRLRNDFRHRDVQMLYNHDIDGNPYIYNSNSEVYEYGFQESYLNTNVYSEYSRTFIEKHNVKVMVGLQTELTKYHDLSAKRNGIIISSIPTLDTTSGTDYQGVPVTPDVTGQYQNWATAGFFGRINYDYEGKYLLEGNIRYDGTSRYRKDKRWNLFPSVSLGWNVAREAFWEPFVPIVNTLKARVSYGELGNQNTTNWYPTYLIQPIGTSNGNWLVNGIRPNTSDAPGLISTSLTWERVRSYNAGIDIGMFNNRLTASVDYFKRQTLNMVGPAPTLPDVLGTDEPLLNNTDLQTKGFELDIAWNDQLSNGVRYNIHFLLSDNQTKVTKYPNEEGLLNTYRKGQLLGEIWGYETIGIAKTQEEMDAHLATLNNGGQSSLGTQWAAGDIMYADINNDKKIDEGANTENDPGDRKIIGNSTPRYSFGLDLRADWKGFDFRAFFQGVMKRDYWQGSYFFWGATNDMWSSTGFTEHLDYFRNDPEHPFGVNTDSYYPRPIFGSSKNLQAQSRYLLNASYIRLKNVQLGYTLPGNIVSKIGIQRVRVFVSGENIWTATRMPSMFDPETVGGGWGGSVYPLSKVYSIGLSINL